MGGGVGGAPKPGQMDLTGSNPFGKASPSGKNGKNGKPSGKAAGKPSGKAFSTPSSMAGLEDLFAGYDNYGNSRAPQWLAHSPIMPCSDIQILTTRLGPWL